MSDICACDDTDCPQKNECYRYNCPKNELWQSYFVTSPRDGDNCNMFIGN